jgi:hypothetical protein
VTHSLWTDVSVSGYGHGGDGRGGGWQGLRQVVFVRTRREFLSASLAPCEEDHYYLTSLCSSEARGGATALLALAREHWEVANCLHHRKDRV